MQDSPLEFARPWWLYAAPGLCVLAVWVMIMVDRWRARALSGLVHPRFRTRLVQGFSAERQRVRRGLWLAAVVLLCVAAAGPQKGYELREVKQRGIDLLFAIDVSRSMLAQDLSPNRLERARMGIHDFVDRLKGDRVGLIPFAGSSFALCPLTLDYEAFRVSLDALDTNIIPRQGTDVASAIREADRLFDAQGNNHRLLVLITDGEDFQGDAVTAAAEAAKKGMVIYPVGVGNAEGVPIPLQLPDGRQDFVRDDTGQPVRTRLDEASLRQLAETTKGAYAPFGRGAEGLEQIYAEKLRLVPQEEREAKTQKVPLERFEWPLAAALLLLILEFLIPERRREQIAKALPSAARRKTVAAVLLAGFCLHGMTSEAAAEAATETDPRLLYNAGTEAYEAGNFPEAETALRAALHSPDLSLQQQAYYNLGNTLYRKGAAVEGEDKVKTWEAAVKTYEDALELNPDDQDARYNRDLVERKLEQLKQQDSKQDQSQNQDGKDGDQKDEQKKDGEQKDGDKSSEQKGGDSAKEDEGKEGTGKQGESGQKDGAEQQQSGEGKDGEKKSGEGAAEGKAGEDGGNGEQAGGAAGEKSSGEERREAGEMNREEALRLLQAMKSQERTVIPVQRDPQTGEPIPVPRPNRRFRDPANSTRGKTW